MSTILTTIMISGDSFARDYALMQIETAVGSKRQGVSNNGRAGGATVKATIAKGNALLTHTKKSNTLKLQHAKKVSAIALQHTKEKADLVHNAAVDKNQLKLGFLADAALLREQTEAKIYALKQKRQRDELLAKQTKAAADAAAAVGLAAYLKEEAKPFDERLQRLKSALANVGEDSEYFRRASYATQYAAITAEKKQALKSAEISYRNGVRRSGITPGPSGSVQAVVKWARGFLGFG